MSGCVTEYFDPRNIVRSPGTNLFRNISSGGDHFSILYYTSIDARLRRASLLRRIVDGASAKALKVCARFSVGVVSD